MSRTTKVLFSFLLLLASSSFAQNITGSISGRILDPTGARVPNASIRVTDLSKGVSATQSTSVSGDFLIGGLQPGKYTLAVEAAGFKKITRNEVVLYANDKLALGDLMLEVGQTSEVIEVSAQAALLQSESVERSAVVSGQQIENTQGNGRNA